MEGQEESRGRGDKSFFYKQSPALLSAHAHSQMRYLFGGGEAKQKNKKQLLVAARLPGFQKGRISDFTSHSQV